MDLTSEDLSEPHVLRLVNHYLSLHIYSTATFLCERLYAQNKDKSHILHKLATCYYSSGDLEKTFMLLRGCTSPDNRYLYSVCAERLGNLQEAERSLMAGSSSGLAVHLDRHEREFSHLISSSSSHSQEYAEETKQFVRDVMYVPNGAAGLYLLGTVCRKGNRKKQATACFQLCLVLEPFFWSAYEALSDMGHEGHQNKFQTAATDLEQREAADPAAVNSSGTFASYATPGFESATPGGKNKKNTSTSSSSSSSYVTPGPDSSSSQTMNINTFAEPRTPSNGSSNLMTTSNGLSTGIPTPRNIVGRPRAHPAERNVDLYADSKLLQLLHILGNAYHLSCSYKNKEALQKYQNLSTRDYNSGWVLHQVAKCYYEIPNYKKAASIFEQLRILEPYRTDGMELYSTTLWQLKKEVELSFLAQQLSQYGKKNAEVWCVVGNCFSFQKEHDLALKFFQRSIQINPRFTYAYTLSGHEYVSNEDFEKAIECYRHAIRIDDRHYNAWFGLGTIYYRQEKYDIAEYHFRKAKDINPRSSVLHSYYGLVLSQRNQVRRVCLF
jgi:anaphase-promoting complex subunit 3